MCIYRVGFVYSKNRIQVDYTLEPEFDLNYKVSLQNNLSRTQAYSLSYLTAYAGFKTNSCPPKQNFAVERKA